MRSSLSSSRGRSPLELPSRAQRANGSGDAGPDIDTARAVPAALRTVETEMRALLALTAQLKTPRVSAAFEMAARLIVTAPGKVLVTGIGKSGLVARKIAATLASTGTPSFYIHPAEASHGDLGMITADDIVLALSWSGETDELSDIINYCHRFDIGLIAMTSTSMSTLARCSDVVLELPLVEEACPNRLAPTSSTIAQAGMGDALAVALMEVRRFSADDFRVNHPRGRLGAQLLRVGELMSTGSELPLVSRNATIIEATLEMTQKRLGVVAIVDGGGILEGAFTDGDLRRSLSMAKLDAVVGTYMTKTPLTVAADQLASEALALMNRRGVMQLFVCVDRQLIGMLHLHDILRAGVV